MAVGPIQTLATLDSPELWPYRTMRMQHAHWVERIFVAEGEKVVRRLLESDHEVVSVLLPEHEFEELRPLIETRTETVRVYLAQKRVLEHLTGFTFYQGLLATGRIPAPLPLEIALARSPRPRLFAAADGLANAENLGALVRNCAAFGVHALVVGETSSSPYLRRAVRSSMGTIFRLPVVETHALVETLRQLQAYGVACVAADPHPAARSPAEVGLTGDCCIVFGSEGEGLAPGVREACGQRVAIPMVPQVDSLNVGSAAAVLLYEANRQRAALRPSATPLAQPGGRG